MKLFVALIALAVASANANIIGLPGFPEGRIINGNEAKAGEAPFIVSLQTTWNAHYCAGSLIRNNIVLTAAHCMTHTKFQVVAGAHSRSDKSVTQVRQGSSARQTIHEKYNGGVGPYDIGLIFLNKPFNINTLSRNAPVATIAVASKQYATIGNGVLFGWGRDSSGSKPDKLQKLNVEIIDYKKCLDNLPRGNKLTNTNVCTFKPGTTDGTCNGDSGGPLVNRRPDGSYQLVGTVSWGYTPCASTKYPSVYTDVASFRDWIQRHINDF